MYNTILARAVRQADVRPATAGSAAVPQRCRSPRVSQRITSVTPVIRRAVSRRRDVTLLPAASVTTRGPTRERRPTLVHFVMPLATLSMATRNGLVAPIATGYRRVFLNLGRLAGLRLLNIFRRY